MPEQRNDLPAYLEKFRRYFAYVAGQRMMGWEPCLRAMVTPDSIVQEMFFVAIHKHQACGADDRPGSVWLKQILMEAIADDGREPDGINDLELKHWLRRILLATLKRTKDHWRAKARYPGRVVSLQEIIGRSSEADGVPDPHSLPEERVWKNELEASLHRAIRELSEDQFKVVRLHFFEGYTQLETARMLNKTRGAVAGLLRRALKELKNHLNLGEGHS